MPPRPSTPTTGKACAAWQGGVVLYSGVHAFALRNGKGMAVPLSGLWER